MKRIASIVVATAVAAAVAATLTMPAGADESATADAKFVNCLRTHGLDIPADTRGDAIKDWLLARPAEGAVRRAVVACKQEGPAGPAPEALVACLKSHGLDAPAAVEDLKPWLGRQFDNKDAEAALRACDVKAPDKRNAPSDAKLGGPCGDEVRPTTKVPKAEDSVKREIHTPAA